MGIQAVGLGLGTLLHETKDRVEIVTGHDFRSYSSAVKMALVTGLLASGCKVYDIGLALSPTAYFAQFALKVDAVAMVTASHNDNGWTGVKMAAEPVLTFGPDEIVRLKQIVLNGAYRARPNGSYVFVEGFAEKYISDLIRRPKLKRRLKVVVACGNGTAGVFAPEVLDGIGCDVIALDTALDPSFPRYNPNPEDERMLREIGEKVRETGADLGIGLDGDGDRCGVVDNEGKEIYSDRLGVLIAREIAREHKDAVFVVDVKSTELFNTDPVLREAGARAFYERTGHSYIKRRMRSVGAQAAFEKSGHFYFGAPLGRGYDDGLITAMSVCDVLGRYPERTLAELAGTLPRTWNSPTMSPHCPDEAKYKVVERVVTRIQDLKSRGGTLAGSKIKDANTINGVRVTLDDGTWGLVRASSNKPELTLVVESPVSEERMTEMFYALDAIIKQNKEVGEYNQSLHDRASLKRSGEARPRP